MTTKSLVLVVSVALAACGGGGGGSSNNTTPTPCTYTPSAVVLAAKTQNYGTPFYASTGTGTGCGNVSNTTVYLLPNTITYAASGVSELSQQQAAEYAEQAISEVKTALGLSSGTGFTGQRGADLRPVQSIHPATKH